MQQRRNITAAVIILLCLVLGRLLKNMKLGLIIGLGLGLLSGLMIGNKKK